MRNSRATKAKHFSILALAVGALVAGCASTADEEVPTGAAEGELRGACVFGSAFSGQGTKVGATAASPLSAFTAATKLDAVREKRVVETVKGVAPGTTTAAEAFGVAGGRIERTSLRDDRGLREFTAYTFRQGGAIHGAIFEVGLADVVARIDAGSVGACTVQEASCIFPADYSETAMREAGFRRVDYEDVDETTTLDMQDNVEAAQMARAVRETAELLANRPFSSAREAAREAGPFSVTRFERRASEFLAVEQDGEVYGAIFEAPRSGRLTLRARFADTQVSGCSAFDAPGRGEGETCIQGGQSPICRAPEMVCAMGLECDTRGADHVCARGICRRP